MKRFFLVLLVAGTAMLLLGTAVIGQGRRGAGRHGRHGMMGNTLRGSQVTPIQSQNAGWCLQLSTEDWQELQTLKTQLWEEGATPDQIHAAVGEWFTEQGIVHPEGWADFPLFCQAGGGVGCFGIDWVGGLGSQLTTEEWQELQALKIQLWEEGKTAEEMHSAIGEWLVEKGIELPEDWADRPFVHGYQGDAGHWGMGSFMGWGSQLAVEDWQELQELMAGLIAEGKTPEEMHSAVGEWLEEKGIALPETWTSIPGTCRVQGGNTEYRGMGRWGGRGCCPVNTIAPPAGPSEAPTDASTEQTSSFEQSVSPTAVEKQSWGQIKEQTQESK